MFVRAPTVIGAQSARATAPNQMLAPSPMLTSPMTTAVGASQEPGVDDGSTAAELEDAHVHFLAVECSPLKDYRKDNKILYSYIGSLYVTDSCWTETRTW